MLAVECLEGRDCPAVDWTAVVIAHAAFGPPPVIQAPSPHLFQVPRDLTLPLLGMPLPQRERIAPPRELLPPPTEGVQ